MAYAVRVWVLVVAAGLVATPGAVRAQTPDKTAAATAAFEKIVSAYLNGKWDELPNAQREANRYVARLTPKQRVDMAYIRTTALEFRPPWWKLCRSTVPTKIRPRIWGRTIQANFKPADGASISGSFDGPRWQKVEVCWNPSLVDNTSPQGSGSAIRDHDVHRGDVGEVVVWQQLGRVHFMASLPVKVIRRLYAENKHLVAHLEWYHAGVTGLYHCSPKARRVTMLLHCSTLQGNSSSSEAYLRSCRALAALFTALVLEDPSKWPSVTLPYTTPEQEIEKSVSTYLYANVSPKWTLAEDRAFRTAVQTFYRANADCVLKNRGKLMLPNHLPFMLMEPDDREHQAKRDEWIKKQLEKAAQ